MTSEQFAELFKSKFAEGYIAALKEMRQIMIRYKYESPKKFIKTCELAIDIAEKQYSQQEKVA